MELTSQYLGYESVDNDQLSSVSIQAFGHEKNLIINLV